ALHRERVQGDVETDQSATGLPRRGVRLQSGTLKERAKSQIPVQRRRHPARRRRSPPELSATSRRRRGLPGAGLEEAVTMRAIPGVGAVGLAAPLAPAQVSAHVSVPAVRVTVAPPPLRVEAQPPPPTAAHVWLAGHWAWRKGRQVWIPGHW